MDSYLYNNGSVNCNDDINEILDANKQKIAMILICLIVNIPSTNSLFAAVLVVSTP